MFVPDQAHPGTIFWIQTLIVGRKSRERERERERQRERETARRLHTNLFVLAWFLRISGQSINLVTTASDEDPKPKLIVRIGFCMAKLVTLCKLSTTCTHF